MAVKRINLMNVPLDILQPEDIDAVTLELIKKEGVQQIVFLTLWDFLKARHNNEFRTMVLNAALVLPLSKSLQAAAKFLNLDVPVRRRPFDVIIDFLNALEQHYKSIYLFGSRKEDLEAAEKNVKATFPQIKILGRFVGHYHKHLAPSIVTAIAKTEPNMVIIGDGITGGPYWVNRNRTHFKSGIFVVDKDILDIFANNKRPMSEKTFNSGMDYVSKIFKNPFRILNIFRYFKFKLLVLAYRIFKIGSKK